MFAYRPFVARAQDVRGSDDHSGGSANSDGDRFVIFTIVGRPSSSASNHAYWKHYFRSKEFGRRIPDFGL